MMLMSNAQPSKDKWIASENLQSNNLHWAAVNIMNYLHSFKVWTLGVVFCSLFLGHDETHHSGLLLAALGRGVEEGVEQEGGVMPVGHHLCKSWKL